MGRGLSIVFTDPLYVDRDIVVHMKISNPIIEFNDCTTTTEISSINADSLLQDFA